LKTTTTGESVHIVMHTNGMLIMEGLCHLELGQAEKDIGGQIQKPWSSLEAVMLIVIQRDHQKFIGTVGMLSIQLWSI